MATLHNKLFPKDFHYPVSCGNLDFFYDKVTTTVACIHGLPNIALYGEAEFSTKKYVYMCSLSHNL